VLNPENITKQQSIKIYKLADKMFRAEIMQRCLQLGSSEIEWGSLRIDAMNELLEFMYGCDNLFEIGDKLGIIKPLKKKIAKKKVKRKNKV